MPNVTTGRWIDAEGKQPFPGNSIVLEYHEWKQGNAQVKKMSATTGIAKS
jgi:hypothetical protein